MRSEKPIAECEECADLADEAFETRVPIQIGEIAMRFLEHVLKRHTSELVGVLAEKYIPMFANKRELR